MFTPTVFTVSVFHCLCYSGSQLSLLKIKINWNANRKENCDRPFPRFIDLHIDDMITFLSFPFFTKIHFLQRSVLPQTTFLCYEFSWRQERSGVKPCNRQFYALLICEEIFSCCCHFNICMGYGIVEMHASRRKICFSSRTKLPL